MGQVHRSMGRLAPASPDLRSEPWIVAKMAASTLGHEHLDWLDLVSNYDNIRSLMERSLNGFDNYNERVLVNPMVLLFQILQRTANPSAPKAVSLNLLHMPCQMSK